MEGVARVARAPCAAAPRTRPPRTVRARVASALLPALTPPCPPLRRPAFARAVTPWSGRQELFGETSLVPASNPGDEGIGSVTAEQFEGRVAKIAMPPKHAMQSATSRIRHWKISFDRQGKWRNGLMGWASGGDTLRTPNLKFESKEDAVAYCTRMGWEYEVELPKAKRSFQGEKDYGDNFLTARAKVLTAKRGEAHFDWPHVGKVRCGARRMCNARSPSPRRARAAPPPPPTRSLTAAPSPPSAAVVLAQHKAHAVREIHVDRCRDELALVPEGAVLDNQNEATTMRRRWSCRPRTPCIYTPRSSSRERVYKSSPMLVSIPSPCDPSLPSAAAAALRDHRSTSPSAPSASPLRTARCSPPLPRRDRAR